MLQLGEQDPLRNMKKKVDKAKRTLELFLTSVVEETVISSSVSSVISDKKTETSGGSLDVSFDFEIHGSRFTECD